MGRLPTALAARRTQVTCMTDGALRSPIWIIDDDQPFREALASMLEGEGYFVAIAENGRTAVDRLREVAFSEAGTKAPCLLLLGVPVAGWRSVLHELGAHRTLDSVAVALLSNLSPLPFPMSEAASRRAPLLLQKPAVFQDVCRLARSLCTPVDGVDDTDDDEDDEDDVVERARDSCDALDGSEFGSRDSSSRLSRPMLARGLQ